MATQTPEQILDAVAHGDAPVLEQLAQMHIDTMENSGLDERTYHLVRLAALIALDSAPVSYLVNLGMARKAGVSATEVQGVFTAIAPIVGTARVASAAGSVLRALGMGEAIKKQR
ncbi:carboxymuconolactone decarboxylase family protein [Carbonactinospora thermoautotrophica]|uniref:Carboxymuconolactone decarboxylase n=1 Tax=Carbonactinospora thermoautotrophica TaxID=1469144 RepID=A0A132MIZ5_9ACTN|nr:carboxymuconolactone decarboxylase family protein [Carbonactinospora thermoautotrophica]KWW97806.1 carboxymuconolactone decarboxylase [Carbonactinospora thermoautotrophica]KWW98472.1 Carboxymuconolactone decarboxylase [Carbonactinospora thermoautotrophica]KWX09969.1 carboxymuconolactone decarboxylase [Carbonactinospora thermoautotrophica]MCX9192089.1 carboxymuconolactone decarboxylase family protein [Carbonactinospora thermoautotrophica]